MSSSQNQEDLNEILVGQLECPVCLNTCTSPIYLCPNGHNVCGDCQPSLKFCPVCRKDGRPSIRNLFAEQVSLNIIAPCQNHAQGCTASLKIRDLAPHLKSCQFGYKCMLGDCDFRGSVSALGKHVKEEHENFFWETNEKGARIFVDNEEYEDEEDLFLTCMLSYKGRFFWLHIDIADLSSLDAVVRMVGPQDAKFASKFSYKLKFISEDGRKKVSYSNNVRALSDDKEEPADCVFDDSFALTCFIREAGLGFRVSLFTDKVVGKAVEGDVGEMDVSFRSPNNWPDLEYREVNVKKEKRGVSDF